MQIIFSYADLWAAIISGAGWVFGILTALLVIMLLIMSHQQRKTDPVQSWTYIGISAWLIALAILLTR